MWHRVTLIWVHTRVDVVKEKICKPSQPVSYTCQNTLTLLFWCNEGGTAAKLESAAPKWPRVVFVNYLKTRSKRWVSLATRSTRIRLWMRNTDCNLKAGISHSLLFTRLDTVAGCVYRTYWPKTKKCPVSVTTVYWHLYSQTFLFSAIREALLHGWNLLDSTFIIGFSIAIFMANVQMSFILWFHQFGSSQLRYEMLLPQSRITYISPGIQMWKECSIQRAFTEELLFCRADYLVNASLSTIISTVSNLGPFAIDLA